MFDKIKRLFYYPTTRYWCGSWIFYNPFEQTFFEACKQHDIAYKEKTKTRYEYDRDFLQSMLEVAKDKAWYHKFRAYLYYYIVRIFWSIYF